jgi:purine-nucleoside phosphorylase
LTGKNRLPILGPPRGRAVINPDDQVRYDQEHGGKNAQFPKDCIVCFYGELFDEAKKHYSISLLENNWWGSLYQISAGSSKLGMIRFGMGDSLAGLSLELLIAKGVRNAIAIGAAGSVSKTCRIGDLVLVTKAIRAEGVSYHYERPSKYSTPSRPLNSKIQRVLDEMGVPYKKGVTWTNGAPFRETVAEIRQLQKEGVLCVEMEAAALFSIAKFRKVNLSSLLFISDSVADYVWNPQFHSEDYASGRNRSLEVAVKALTN